MGGGGAQKAEREHLWIRRCLGAFNLSGQSYT